MKKNVILGIVVGVIILVTAGFFFLDSINTVKDIQTNSESQEAGQVDSTDITSPKSDVGGTIEGSGQEDACSRTFSTVYSDNELYRGDLFDAHLHMPNVIDYSSIDPTLIEEHEGSIPQHGSGTAEDRDAEIDKILCVFEKEKVLGVIGFVEGDQSILDSTIEGAKSVRQRGAEKLKLFLMPLSFNSSTLDSISLSNPELFDGYGEIAMYFGPQKGESPDDQKYLDIYQIAEKQDLIVMIHPDARQESKLENVFKNYPNVKFLLHGPEIENAISGLMFKYSNVYYSIDAILLRYNSPGGLLYTVNSKEDFKSTLSQNYDVIMNSAVNDWKSLIEQHPDRIMWGTDRSTSWHYDDDTSLMLEEFARDFIDKLDPPVQEKFAYQNAERLLTGSIK